MTHNQVNEVRRSYDDIKGKEIYDHEDNWFWCLSNSLPKPSLWKRILRRLGLGPSPEQEWKQVEELMIKSAEVPIEEVNVWQLKQSQQQKESK